MNTDSQRIKILRWLSQGHTLTTWQAITKWGCTTASQRVTELKRHWPVKSRMVQRGSARVAEYFIPEAQAVRVRKAIAS